MGRPILFICPETKLNVQHWLGNEEDVPDDEYESAVLSTGQMRGQSTS
jgi:hypothetical protein